MFFLYKNLENSPILIETSTMRFIRGTSRQLCNTKDAAMRRRHRQ